MSVVIGIDQSYNSTGVCILDENKNVVDLFKIVTPPSVGDIFARAHTLATTLGGLVGTHMPIGIGLEGLAFAMTGDATRDLAGLQFVIVNTLRYEYDYNRIVIPSPNTVKKLATGKGNSNKEALYSALPEEIRKRIEEKNYRKTTGMYDVTDAYWIAVYTLEHFRTE
jgi:Holliday junction resolvasome RuvABC endonuclease subunit